MPPTTTPDDELSYQPFRSSEVPAILIWAPLLVALLAVTGSLWLSIGMKLKACPLCFYQRTFVMGAVERWVCFAWDCCCPACGGA